MFFVVFSACQEPISISLPEGEEQLVAFANFSPNDYIKVYISEERLLNSDSIKYVDNATVRILLNNRPIGTMTAMPADGTYPDLPFYQSNFRPGENRNYTLEVDVPNYPQLRAVSMIPDIIPINQLIIDSVVTNRLTDDREESLFSFFGHIEINDPQSVKNYYHFAEAITPIDWFTIFQGDTVLTSNQEYFLAPVFNVDTEDPAFTPLEHENGFLIDDATFDGQLKKIPFRASVAFDADFRLINRLVVLFRSVSADYFFYHSSLSKQIVAEESPFSEPVIIYDNVENGLGNFSGYGTAMDSIVLNR